MTLVPSPTQFRELSESDSEEPVIMLNLLRFKPEADGIDEGLSGLEAYQRYGAAAAPFLARVGGRLLCGAETSQMVIGPEALEWDMALMVEYPSRKKFLEMATDPDYLAIHAHRSAALSDSRLIACDALPSAVSAT